MLKKFSLFACLLLFFVSKIALAAFSCDSGTLSTTCYVTSTKTLSDGEKISGSGNLIIRQNGKLQTADPSHSISIEMGGNVVIESGGQISANISLLRASNLEIQSGAKIDAFAKGYLGGDGYQNGQGPGGGGPSYSGYSLYVGGAGGGYGGNGGDGSCKSSSTCYPGKGGSAYGSLLLPNDLGSGGGGACSYYWYGYCNSRPEYYRAKGGRGGGKVKIEVSNNFTLNGEINASGEDGECKYYGYTAGGGGSGGSVLIQTNIFSGSGKIIANGGSGMVGYCKTYDRARGGGGAGGRVAVYRKVDSFSGGIFVNGGEGRYSGQNGSIVRQTF